MDKEKKDAFNKLFKEVSNSSSKKTSKKNKKGKRKAEKISIKKGAGINVRYYKDFARQQWKELEECLEKLIKDETATECKAATECKEVPLHFASLVGVGDIIKLFEEVETELYPESEERREKISDEIEKERNKMFGTLERRNLPKLEGKVWNMGEIRKRDASLIKRDLDEACGEMMKKLNKWGSRKFA